jgi:transposase
VAIKAHPGIEVVSRDRYQPYIDGISRAAPKALQVADRLHLTKNLTDTLEHLLERERISLESSPKAHAARGAAVHPAADARLRQVLRKPRKR